MMIYSFLDIRIQECLSIDILLLSFFLVAYLMQGKRPAENNFNLKRYAHESCVSIPYRALSEHRNLGARL